MKRDASPGTVKGNYRLSPSRCCGCNAPLMSLVRTPFRLHFSDLPCNRVNELLRFQASKNYVLRVISVRPSLVVWKRVYRGSHLSMLFDVRLLSGPMSARIG